VVHRILTDNFLLLENKKVGINKIIEENEMESKGFQISQIAWLRQKDKPAGKHRLLGIWFNTHKVAE
jgi:hypothetical protein